MKKRTSTEALDRLLNIMARLRSPDGCPWDAEQTPETLRPYLIEEAYEVIDAIDNGDPAKVCEELGDLLLQIVFHACIFEERGDFSFTQVADSISEKLIRRHPHVFSTKAQNPDLDLEAQWEQIKTAERDQEGASNHFLSGIPRHLPALQRGQKILQKCSRNGAELPAHINLDLNEMQRLLGSDENCKNEVMEPERMVGELLLKVVELARQLDVDAENALRMVNRLIVNEIT